MKKLVTTICLMLTPLFASGGTAFEGDPTNYFVSGSVRTKHWRWLTRLSVFSKTQGPKNSSMTASTRRPFTQTNAKRSVRRALLLGQRLQRKVARLLAIKRCYCRTEDRLNRHLERDSWDAETDPVITKGWFALILKEEMGPGQTMEMFIVMFIDMVQTAGVSAENPKGEWSMRYSLSQKDMQFCPECQTILKDAFRNWLHRLTR